MNPDEAVLLWADEYSRMAESYEATVVPRFTPFAANLVQRAKLNPHTVILDVSTGTGLTALLAAKAIGGTGLVVGIDLADGALAVAKTKASRMGLRDLRFEMLDSRNIVYRGGTFDVVLCSFGLPSIGHEQVLREVYRVLKDGAAFHLLMWAPRDPPAGWDAWEEVVGAHKTATPSKILAQLREAGDLVTKSGDYAAVREPATLTAEMKEVGFSSVRAERETAPVDFATADDLIGFHGAFGATNRELGEMDDSARQALRQHVEERFRKYRDTGGVRLHWSVVYYDATK